MTPCNLEEFVFPWKLKLLVNSFCKFRCRTSKVFIPLINLLKSDNFTVCLDCVAMELVHIWHLVLRLSDCLPRSSYSRQGLWDWGCCFCAEKRTFSFPPCSTFPLLSFSSLFSSLLPSLCFFHMSFVRGLLEGSIFWESFLLPNTWGLSRCCTHSSLLAV